MQRPVRPAAQPDRDPAGIGLEPRLNLAKVPPAERADYVAAWQRLGATYLTIATMGAGYATVDDHLGALEVAIADLRRSGLHGAATD